jgi:hypothetical protein
LTRKGTGRGLSLFVRREIDANPQGILSSPGCIFFPANGKGRG